MCFDDTVPYVVTPSPQFHDILVAPPVVVDVSLSPAGHSTLLLVAGVYMHNGGSGGAVVVIYNVVVLVDDALVTVSVIGTVPTSVNENDGFCKSE